MDTKLVGLYKVNDFMIFKTEECDVEWSYICNSRRTKNDCKDLIHEEEINSVRNETMCWQKLNGM